MKKKVFLVVLAALMGLPFLSSTAKEATHVKLPRIISNGMVLQRGDTITLWGKAEAGKEVEVIFRKKTYKTTATPDGKFDIKLPPQKAGGPYTLTVGDQTLEDIYVGDVWMCSGQSNMDVHIERVHRIYEEEVRTTTIPQIHLIQAGRNVVPQGEQEDWGAGTYNWESLNPDVIMHWSALSYFFAKEMWQQTGVPQGLVNVSMGGSDILAWLNRENAEKVAPRAVQNLDFMLQPGYLERNGRINQAIGRAYEQAYESDDPGLQQQWMKPETDDSQWETVNQFDHNIGSLNGRPWRGSLWFRKSFEVPAELAGKEATLYLGYMIDSDESYLNGEKVGSTGYEYPPRIYKVRAGLLKAGTNHVCIRLKTGGNPTKFKTDKPYKLVCGETEIPLGGEFKMKRGVMMPARPGVEGVGNGVPTVLHNSMIAPIKKYRFAGMIWYQGETNVGRAAEYNQALPALVSQWRSYFGEIPVVICNLANYTTRHDKPVKSAMAELREVQRRVAVGAGNAGLANMADLGEWNDIHPWRKKEAAHRVFLQMKHLRLGDKKSVYEGPAYESVAFEDGKAVLTFRPGTGKLVARKPIIEQRAAYTPAEQLPVDEEGKLLGFTIASKDGKFYNAEARIEGNKVVVWSENVKEPAVVRYGWDEDPVLSLYNEEHLPAAPFSTETSLF